MCLLNYVQIVNKFRTFMSLWRYFIYEQSDIMCRQPLLCDVINWTPITKVRQYTLFAIQVRVKFINYLYLVTFTWFIFINKLANLSQFFTRIANLVSVFLWSIFWYRFFSEYNRGVKKKLCSIWCADF